LIINITIFRAILADLRAVVGIDLILDFEGKFGRFLWLWWGFWYRSGYCLLGRVGIREAAQAQEWGDLGGLAAGKGKGQRKPRKGVENKFGLMLSLLIFACH
jgi:hypothetical protein